jgi:hypothetical protein
MEQSKSKFPTMGNSAATTAKNPSGAPERGVLVKKKNTAAGDPYKQAKPSPKHRQVTSARAYGITTKMPSYVDPQIGPTQGNGRLFKASTNRTAPNFTDGMSNYN